MKQVSATSVLHDIASGIRCTINKKLSRVKTILKSEEIQKTLIFGMILALLLLAANLEAIL